MEDRKQPYSKGKTMCHRCCIDFVRSSLENKTLKGKKVLEIGSCDINGSIRAIVMKQEPLEYIGIDISEGPGVDMICPAEDILRKFGNEAFDVVISTEVLEHIRDWRLVISNMKNVLKPGGVLLLTTRSKGFGYHGYPYDFWRYEVHDMQEIFSDFEVINIMADPIDKGVFAYISKPEGFKEKDLSAMRLYSVIFFRRLKNIGFFSMFFLRVLMKPLSLAYKRLPVKLKQRLSKAIYRKI